MTQGQSSLGARAPGPRPFDVDPTHVADLVFEGLHRAALHQEDDLWSGPELIGQVNTLATELRELGVGTGVRVALRVALGHRYVVGLLAILRCGGSVLPVDPGDDWAWTTTVRLCGPRVVVTNSGCAYVDVEPVTAVPGEAWLLPTSGSTGSPRIVVGSARGLLERLEWGRQWFAASTAERCGVISPGTFIDALTHVLGTLGAGRVLVLPPSLRDDHGGWLRRFLATSNLHQLVSVPSVLPSLAAERDFRLPGLTRWIFSGELLRGRWVELAQRIAPRAEVLNSYGSTETTGDVAVSRWPPAADVPDPVPVGFVQGATLWRLGRQNDGTEVLQCGGHQIALTVLGAERAIITANGVRWYSTGDTASMGAHGLTVTGRVGGASGFAKVRGRRIDLAMVETGLESLPLIKESTAMVWTGPMGTEQLLGFVAAESLPPDWRATLRGRVPQSHMPDRVVVVPALPRTSSGKVDQAAALRLSRVIPNTGAGFPDAVVSVAAHILGYEVALNDNLVETGLDSLSAVALSAALEEAFGIPCAPQDLFRENSLGAIARYMLAQPVREGASIRCLRSGLSLTGPSARPMVGSGTVLVLFPPAVGTSLGYFRLVSHLRFTGQIDAIELGAQERAALDDGGQEALATLCADRVQERHASAPIVCLGWSFGAAIAARCQIVLASRGLDTPHLVLLDPAMFHVIPGEDVQQWARRRLWEDSDYAGPTPTSMSAFVSATRSSGRLALVHPDRIEEWLHMLAATRQAASEGFSSRPTTTTTVLRAMNEGLLNYPAWLSESDPRIGVVDIDSTHFRLLGEDALPTVAAVIDDALEHVNGDVAG